ncbi:EAL domain-containing protein [Thioalkalivibrio sp. ALE30]|uniref:EAL domain-containing protein n=1 Tax=Thioalkalivibrio sp. ALE30 TaxID=1158181 RepID=UPI000376EC32|nr:EAL domain-containing protein [Thioalkalivibrio sp. ALE30]
MTLLDTSHPATVPRAPLMLVVDDVREIRDELVESACQHGIAAHGASGLAEARRRLRAMHYDLILLDLKLPEGDGLDLLTELRRMGPAAPAVAFLSGLNEDILNAAGDVAWELGLDVLGSLGKPVRRTSLLDLFQRLENQPSTRPRDELAATIGRQELSERLAQGQLNPYLQPQYCLRSGKLLGFEALARLTDDQQGKTLRPAAFAPYLDNPEFAWPMFWQIFRRILSQAPALRECFGDQLRLSINAGAEIFGDPRFPGDLVRAWTEAALPPHALMIELTENAPSLSASQRMGLAQARIAGFGISLDDFGAGSAGLTRLAQLPLTEVKVDSWFIRNATSDRRRQALLRDIAILCNHRAIESVIEGIEDQNMLQMAQRFGFAAAQGYLLGHPIPIEAATQCAASCHVPAPPSPDGDIPDRHVRATDVELDAGPVFPAAGVNHTETSPWCLIVDDDRDIREEMSAILTDEGITCWLASTISDAEWQLANIDDVAVIFIDIDLPDGNGLQLLQHPVFIERQVAPIPVILTSHGQEILDKHAFEHGAEHLEKPASREAIRDAFRRACARSPLRKACQFVAAMAQADG